MIISASRRTDIPAFYSDWFLHRLEEGCVAVANPYNSKQLSKVMLTPQTIDCIVFWSKNPAPMLDKLSLINKRGYKYYFQFTLNPYEQEWEQCLPDKTTLSKTFSQLGKRSTVVWRYDPIIVSDKLSLDYHSENFFQLAKKLSNYTDRCDIGFLDVYAKLKKLGLTKPNTETMMKIAQSFADIASSQGLQLFVCNEEQDFSTFGIQPASCIDKLLIEKIIGCKINARKDPGQRKLCNCVQSVDIGMYDSCTHGCIYCYANKKHQLACQNQFAHDKNSLLLIGSTEQKTLKEKQLTSCKDPCTSLF